MVLFPKKTVSFLLLFSLFSLTKAQEFSWENMSFGVAAQYTLTGSDLNEFWGNFPSAGIAAEYSFSDNFSFEASINAAYLKARENSRKLPDIIFLNMPGGFKYYFISGNKISFNFLTGLTNSTFAFQGEAADRLGENFIESEFGIFASLGISFIILNNLNVEWFFSGQNIFSSPEEILLLNSGVKIFWK